MIDITIKTLDSRNHVFSVEDELTVKQLKEKIAEPVNVPVESQRLIYCGRVLVDEKKLSEYDVHGKVIHLVQRAPPTESSSSSSGSGGGGSEARTGPPPRRGPFRTIISPGQVDGATGNAMYLGAMAFPADLMDAQGISMPPPRHRLSQSRLSVARGLLRRARYTLLNLENPSSQVDFSNGNSSNLDEVPNEIGAQGEDIGVDISASTSNVGVQHPPHINVEGSSGEGEMQADESESASDRNSPEESAREEPGTRNASEEPSDSARNSRYRFPGLNHMAEVIFFLRDVERRFGPFLERFHDLVRQDPVLENPAEAQRLFDLVSKLMHYLAHAYHAISDIMCDFSQPPPRRLRCRPVLIQHSAVLQTGIPIQAQLNVGGTTNVSFTSSSSPPSNNNNQGTGSTPSAPPASNPSADVNPPTSIPDVAETIMPPPPPVAPEAPPHQPTSTAQPSSNETGRSGNLGGGNFEVYMDVGQGSITIDSVEATLVSNSGQGGIPESLGNSWNPPPEFLQRLMQTLASPHFHMEAEFGGGSSSGSGNNGGTGASPTAAPPGGGGGGAPPSAPAPDQPPSVTNSQARGMGPGFFDPFLPCNSHHIHGGRRRTETGETTVNNNPTSSTTQSSSQSQGTSTENPPRPSTSEPPPSFLNLFSNLFSGLRGAGGPGAGGGGPSLIRILPRDVTVFLQSTPPLQNMNINRETTVAELLQNLPDYSASEPTSIFSDFVMTLARNLRVVDMFNMGSPNSNILAGLRPSLREFIRTKLLQGEGNQAVTDAVNRINNEMRPLIESILSQEDIPFREEIDVIATINQLNHTTLPILIRDILEEDDANYARDVPNHCNYYARHLASILYHCCQNGQQGLEAIYTTLARRFIVGVPPVLRNWSVSQLVSQLRAMNSVLETSRDAIQPLLVYRMPDAPAEAADQQLAMETEPVNGRSPAAPTEAMSPAFSPVVPSSEPQPPVEPPRNGFIENEIHENSEGLRSSPRIEREMSPPQMERDVTWQSAVPPDWVPIISRDRERQRRQAVQGAFSDAYLAGMPTKRRKLIKSSKPPANLSRVISDSMSSALGAAGLDGVDPGVAETAGGDMTLRAAYREQVKSTLTPTLRQHPDFTPEKYPAAAKLFNSK